MNKNVHGTPSVIRFAPDPDQPRNTLLEKKNSTAHLVVTFGKSSIEHIVKKAHEKINGEISVMVSFQRAGLRLVGAERPLEGQLLRELLDQVSGLLEVRAQPCVGRAGDV